MKIRQITDHGEQFRPPTTSPFSLLLNEQSQIKNYEGSNFADYLNLLQLPTKPLATFVALADVHRRVSADEGRVLEILRCDRIEKDGIWPNLWLL